MFSIDAHLYSCFQRMVGADRCRAALCRDYLRPPKDAKWLDLGCGTAEILEWLPDTRYTGVDLDGPLLGRARKKYGARANFIAADLREPMRLAEGASDLVTAFGVLHHLDDAAVRRVVAAAYGALKSGGRFVTLDGCHLEGESWIVRALLDRDRGKHVRSPEGYAALAGGYFQKMRVEIRKDLLTIPYAHCVMVFEKA